MDHPTCRVVKAGTYGPPTRRRQLWWCYPDGDRAHPDRHRLAEELPRTLLDPGEGFCADCTTHLEVHEGPIHPRAFEHGPAARHGANGTMVADWVGVYAPAVTRQLRRGVSWPEVVAFDELLFLGRRVRGRKKQPAAWGVFAAYAYPENTDPATGHPLQPKFGKSRGYQFALGATPVLSAQEATRFLRSYPGRPRYVIADGSNMWAKAFADAWPEVVDDTTGEDLEKAPLVLPCLWHLGGVVQSWLRASSRTWSRSRD